MLPCIAGIALQYLERERERSGNYGKDKQGILLPPLITTATPPLPTPEPEQSNVEANNNDLSVLTTTNWFVASKSTNNAVCEGRS